MATRTRTGSSKTSRTTAKRGTGTSTAKAKPRAVAPAATDTTREPSAFSFGTNGGALFGAALAGAAIGFAANYGRKLLVQGMEATAGEWDAILAAEHEAALAIFDKMLATDATQTARRKTLLARLTHALDKHAHQEEMVVYPALREANQGHDADVLESEHGQVKTFLYELGRMSADAPAWLDKVRAFRSMIAAHMRMEEDRVFPEFKQGLSEEQTRKITALVNRDGFWMT